MITFKEGVVTGDQIKISQSHLMKQENQSNYVKFKTLYNGDISKNSISEYIDFNGNTILTGKIKQIKEIANDPQTDKKIIEVKLYDYGYNLIDGNLNKIYESGETPESIIQDIVEDNNLTFSNEDISSDITIEKRKAYLDRNPIEAINELCDTIGARWIVNGTTFYLFRRGNSTSSVSIDGTSNWTIPEGWIDDSTSQCTKVIVKGATILQRTDEQLSGTDTTFYTTRTPEDVKIEGLVQTTENIDGDYEVTKGEFDVGGNTKRGKIVFDSSQTDPLVTYSYSSQIRVQTQIGDGDIVKEVKKSYIESSSEAREFARKYLELYSDGLSTGKWKHPKPTNFNLNNIRPGDLISVTNKLNPNRDGNYIIHKINRRYPREIQITVGEDTTNLINWQEETKDRIKQLEAVDSDSDFVQIDQYIESDFEVTANTEITKLIAYFDTGDILFASETELDSDGDLISDTGSDDDYALAYDDDATFPTGSKTDYLES